MRRNLLFLAIACTGLLAACTQPGGGGGVPANVAPLAAIGASTTSGVAHLSVDFTSASTDSDGTIASYAWDFGDGTTSTAAAGQALYTEAGAYLVELTVTDDDGATATTTQIITVTDDAEGRYVANGGVDAPGCQSSLAPCATVTYAVGQADVTGDTVYVDSGTYPEMVYVAKDVAFKGANQGNSAGASPETRRAESTLKGIRTGAAAPASARPGIVQRSIQIDGFAFDPQGDAAFMTVSNQALVWLVGGPNNVVENSRFNGGTYTPNCGSTCASMVDNALEIRSGDIVIRDNGVANFRRAVNIYQVGFAGVTINSASFTGNTITGHTSRGLQIAPSGQNKSLAAGVTVSDNVFDATGYVSPSGPGSIIVTTGPNTFTDNTFVGAASGIYFYMCTSTQYVAGAQTVQGNTFDGNGSAVVLFPETLAQCGFGNIDGTVISENNFNTGTSGISVSNPSGYFGTGRTAIDGNCNWWGVDTGANTGGRTATVDPGVLVDQWLDAPAPGGNCTP